MFCFTKLNDLMDLPETTYTKITSDQYDAEKGLLELYRNFVSEMLKISLAGVAVLGFLQNVISNNGTLDNATKWWGLLSMSAFAISSICALIFLYYSAEGYRYYIAGIRAKEHSDKYSPEEYVSFRKCILRNCVVSKAGSAFFLGLGAILTVIAIATVLF